MKKRIALGLLLLTLLIVALPLAAGAATYPTLRWGTRGPYVSAAQRKLRAWGYYHGAIDGVYGRKMYGAVITFQRKNGLRVDGVVGLRTWQALGFNATAPGQATAARRTTGGTRAASRTGDADLLARVISAEARGEPFEGQVAVGAVLLNRVRDSRFPHTLAGVIYQTHAFESVANGSIYGAPTASSVRAARDALNGWDPTGGAVFFWNPSKPVSGWIWSRPIIKRIGNHVFAR
jgi:N-acetylmuramoyl-L-alanine amidase